MKHICIVLLAWMIIINQAGQEIYVCKNARISLFSSAPIEDIKAATSTAASVFNATTGDVAFNVAIRSFQFPKSLMQEHFNDDYMESDKFPKATFRGKIKEHVDLSAEGSSPVTAVGDLTVHGVTRPRSISGEITVKGGVVTMTAEFMVKCADHHIKIPSLVFHNIAEDLRMNVAATYTPYQTNQTR